MASDGMVLAGKRILVVEDEWFIAKGLVRDLRNAGADVSGVAPSISEALILLRAEPPDGAVLDIELRGEMAFMVADALIELGVPFVLATGYDADVLPAPYRNAPWCGKPVEVDVLAAALFPDREAKSPLSSCVTGRV